MRFGKTKFGKTQIAESPRIQDLCYRYLLKYKEYQEQGRKFYYQDETFIYTSEYKGFSWSNRQEECLHQLKTSSTGAMLIVAHVGSNTGWVTDAQQSDCSFIMNSANPFADYHKNMNAHNFELWMERQIIPNMETNSVLVMDNCAFHKVIPDKKPNSSARNKKVFVDYIIAHHSEHDESHRQFLQHKRTRKQLQEIVNEINIDQSTGIERIIRASGKDIKVLFMPPYHSVFNPIELQWSQLKRHVRDNNHLQTEASVKSLLKDGFKKTDSMWTDQIRHTEKIQRQELDRFEEVNLEPEFVDNTVDLDSSSDEELFFQDNLRESDDSDTDSAPDEMETDAPIDDSDDELNN